MRLLPLVLTLQLSVSVPLSATPAPQVEVDPRIVAAEQQLRAFQEKHHIPGLAVAIGLEGQVVYHQAFGVADLATKAPVTADSVFPLGSTSKALTGLLLGQLVESGKIDLDAPIQTYVPYFPPKNHPITARLLAGHLAGLRNYNRAAGEYENRKSFPTVEAAVGIFKDDPLEFEPGTRHAYSVYSFVLLSAALEGASGKRYLDLLHDQLAKPLGLSSTGPCLPALPGLVSSYSAGFLGMPVPAPPTDLSNKWAAGGLASTPLEMVRLGNAVLAGRVVRPETFTLLTTPQRLKDGSDSGAGYGMGWRSGTRKLGSAGRDVRVVHHGGTANGAMSFFVIFPEERLVISLNGNLLFEPFADFSAQAYALAEIFLGQTTATASVKESSERPTPAPSMRGR